MLRRVTGNGEDGLMGGRIHKVEQQLTAEQIHREIINIPTEHGGEDHRHNQHDQQRIQNAPNVSQPAATVFELDIFLDQQHQKISVFPKLPEVAGQFSVFAFQKNTYSRLLSAYYTIIYKTSQP